MKFLKTYPLSTLLVVIIWCICLLPLPETPLDDVTLIDKWVHIAMFFVLTMTVGHEYFHSHRQTWSVAGIAFRAWLLPTLMGGMVELAQEWLTTCRTGDWIDFAADSVGTIIGFALCTAASVFLAKRAGQASAKKDKEAL